MTLLLLSLFVSLFTTIHSVTWGVATLEPTGNNTAHGTVWFQLLSSGRVNVTVSLEGVPNGDHGLHVHSYGDITDKEAASNAGGHYVGLGSPTHSCPPSSVRHQGDMGNWTAINGSIKGSKDFDLLTLTDTFSIVGRSLILHALPDNCTGDSGNAGARISQGVIGIANKEGNNATNNVASLTYAIASLSPTTNCESCRGTVWLRYVSDLEILITAQLYGLENETIHGFYIHQYGDLTSSSGNSSGDHYNPDGVSHRLPPNYPRHAGDLGNIQSYDQEGVAWYQYLNDNLVPFESLLGRTISVSFDRDYGDGLGCDNSGNSGSTLMQGVLGIASADKTPTVPITLDTNWEAHDCVVRTESVTLDINFYFEGMIPQPSCPCDK